MHHVLAFGYWRAAWWRNLASPRTELCPELAEGLAAYAAEQAVCEEARASGWAAKWAPVHERAQAVLLSMASDALMTTFPPLYIDINLQLDKAKEDNRDNEDL